MRSASDRFRQSYLCTIFVAVLLATCPVRAAGGGS
nr:MAG TPA: hypothetical protein [Caudoviricetes sp.]